MSMPANSSPVIRAAQAARNLQVDGSSGRRQSGRWPAMSVASRIEKVNLALERLRWLPSDLTERFVFLKRASCRAQYFEKGPKSSTNRAKRIYGKTLAAQTYFVQGRGSP